MAEPNTIVAEGVDAFPENRLLIQNALSNPPIPTGKSLLEHHPRYHGYKRPGCILVRKRREKTNQAHYLDIYCCYTCGLEKECLRSGWEIGWWDGINVRELK